MKMGYKLPDVTNCCFVVQLQTGALLIGYLAALSALFNTMGVITVLVLVAVRDRQAVAIDHSTEIAIYASFGIQLVVVLMHLTLAVMLIIGVHKKIPRYLWYYYVAGGINLVLQLVMICVTALFNGFYVTFGQLLACAIQFYFLLVVRSAHAQLEEQLKPPDVELSYRATPAPAATPPLPPSAPLIRQA